MYEAHMCNSNIVVCELFNNIFSSVVGPQGIW